ncbi:hypothetical protein F8M41_001584 [Gigaspora margarita]|uniref:Uncharacterized protein n=1 Tax=Gigaspora margarita TaxID=4874 RepID=A0A8H3XGQ0_GIGMA|nr:hypothetical protein F8M41_001584 [Gigaspora margarita]
MMVKTIKNKKEIIRSSLNLIWEATKREVREIFFNEPLGSATVFLNSSNNDTENLGEQQSKGFQKFSIKNTQMQVENNISRILEQTTQSGVIGSIQNNNHEDNFNIGDDDSPEWLECEDCYRNKKELCEYWDCSKSFTQLNSSRISTSLYLVNQVEGSIDEDNTSDEESQS